MLAPAFIGRAQAEAPVKGEIKVTTDGGFVRLVFLFEKEVPASIELTYPIMVVTFKKPVAIAVDRLNASAPDTISAARLDPDGTSIRIALKREVKLNSIPVAERLYVDLLPANWTGIMPGLPREVVDGTCQPRARSRTSIAPATVPAQGEEARGDPRQGRDPADLHPLRLLDAGYGQCGARTRDGKLTLDFDQPIKWDLADAKAALPPTLQSIDADVEDDSTSVTFAFNGAPQVRTFREDRSIVVDVDHDGGKPKQAAGEGAKPEQAAQAGHRPGDRAARDRARQGCRRRAAAEERGSRGAGRRAG